MNDQDMHEADSMFDWMKMAVYEHIRYHNFNDKYPTKMKGLNYKHDASWKVVSLACVCECVEDFCCRTQPGKACYHTSLNSYITLCSL